MDADILLFWGIIWAIIGGLVTPFVYKNKDRNPWMGAFVGVIFGALGGILLLGPLWIFVARRGKQCPRCAETVHVDALVCKYCGHEFTTALADVSPTPRLSSYFF